MGWYGPQTGDCSCCEEPPCDSFDIADTPTEEVGDWGSPTEFGGVGVTQTTTSDDAILTASGTLDASFDRKISATVRTSGSGVILDYVDSDNYVKVICTFTTSAATGTCITSKVTAGVSTVLSTLTIAENAVIALGGGDWGIELAVYQVDFHNIYIEGLNTGLGLFAPMFGSIPWHGGDKVGLITGTGGGDFSDIDAVFVNDAGEVCESLTPVCDNVYAEADFYNDRKPSTLDIDVGSPWSNADCNTCTDMNGTFVINEVGGESCFYQYSDNTICPHHEDCDAHEDIFDCSGGEPFRIELTFVYDNSTGLAHYEATLTWKFSTGGAECPGVGVGCDDVERLYETVDFGIDEGVDFVSHTMTATSQPSNSLSGNCTGNFPSTITLEL